MIRAVLTRVGLIVLAAAVPGSAQAQFYKGKTITMIVNYPAGGPTDLEGRIVALHLPAHIPGNPTIVVKNVGGAGGLIGSNQLGEAAPNGEIDRLLHVGRARPAGRQPRRCERNYSDFVLIAGVENPAGGLHPQGYAARPQRRGRLDEDQGLQGALAQRPEHQHHQPGRSRSTCSGSSITRCRLIAA